MKLEVDDITYNFDNWNKSNNILFVTGLSGSGKSTLSDEISKEYNCKVFHLDDFRNNSNTSSINLINKFKMKYPETKEYFEDNWSDVKMFEKYFIKFFDFLLSYCNNHDELFVIEGIQIYHLPYNNGWFSKKPLIVKGTTIEKCYKRQIERGSTKLNNIKQLKKDASKLSKFLDRYKSSKALFESMNIMDYMRKM